MLTNSEIASLFPQVNFVLPAAYHRIGELNLTNIYPWRFFSAKDLERFGNRTDLISTDGVNIPFAERVDNDDSAVFRVFPDKVTIVIQHWGAESDYYINGDFWVGSS